MSENKKPTSTARSVAFVGGAQAWRLFLTFLTAPVLGRLLSPADFGLIATSAPILAFVTMIQSLGLTQAIVQRQTITKGQMNALFWMSAAVSLALAGGLWAAAPFLADFFEQPHLAGVIRAGAALIVVSAVAGQPVALLTRNLQFRTLAFLDVIGTSLGAILSIAIAWSTRSYWALMAPPACAVAVNLVGAALAARWRPGRPVWDAATRQMMGFGAGLSTFNILNFFARNADNLLIAKVNGATALGLYDRAYKLMLVPLTQATMPLGRVLTPVLSRFQDDPERYRRTYADAVGYLMIAVQPGVLCAVVYAHATVTLLLGDSWSDAVPIFAWLGIAGLHQTFTSTVGWLFISQGRTRDLAVVGGVNSASTIGSFIVGLPWGPLGVAIAYVCSDYVLRLPFTWYMTGRTGHITFAEICRIAGPHAAGLCVSALCLVLLLPQVGQPSLPELGVLALISYAASVATLLAFRSKRVLLGAAVAMVRRRLGASRHRQ
jgi:PST family polysaccharide transporter